MAVDGDRFESKVDRTGPHHLWTGARSARGIGQIRIDGRLLTALPGAGSMSEVGDGSWKLVVSAGSDDTGARRRVVRTVHGSRQTATRALAAVVTEIGDGSRLPRRTNQAVTVSELVA